MLLVTANIFQPLIDVFESVIEFFHNTVGVPWGFSIVLLTITVRACLVPLTVKQLGNMARLQQLQPQIKEIQAKYKEDKQRLQQETMKFYRENNVNPLSSCLPMALQLPVLISLYYMLRKNLRTDICPAIQKAFQHSYEIKHHVTAAVAAGQTTACGSHGASFLFIGDLTNKATGVTLIVLIVLYVGSQLGSSLIMTATMDQTQRRLMLFMPVLFVLFVIRFPAGVLVYWITTNLWTIGQQYIVKQRIGPLRAAAVSPAGGGGSGGGGILSRSKPDDGGPAKPGPNGSSGGGLAGLVRKPKAPEKEPVATVARSSAPPKPPRKKKKRSGRRR